MRDLKNLGKLLNRKEQKQIHGGGFSTSCVVSGNSPFSFVCNGCLFFGAVCSQAALTQGQCEFLGGVYCG